MKWTPPDENTTVIQALMDQRHRGYIEGRVEVIDQISEIIKAQSGGPLDLDALLERVDALRNRRRN